MSGPDADGTPSRVVDEFRRDRWKEQPANAEADYDALCSHWESLTDADIWGPAGRPPLPQLPPNRVAS